MQIKQTKRQVYLSRKYTIGQLSKEIFLTDVAQLKLPLFPCFTWLSAVTGRGRGCWRRGPASFLIRESHPTVSHLKVPQSEPKRQVSIWGVSFRFELHVCLCLLLHRICDPLKLKLGVNKDLFVSVFLIGIGYCNMSTFILGRKAHGHQYPVSTGTAHIFNVYARAKTKHTKHGNEQKSSVDF